MEKKFNQGLVLGKFMPPHNGHLYLINTAAEQCEKVFVIIGSLKNEPINGILRYNWLRLIYQNQKNIEIIHCTDENPQKPEECESLDVFYNQYWVPSVHSRVKNLDVIFTSEAYGDEFASYLGIKHVLVDINRDLHPVSGTLVRDNSIKHWNYIPDEVKPYYTKRIVIVGPESTGKTTLTNRLATHYNTQWVPEYGREYTETIKKGTQLEVDDFYAIAVRHNEDILDKHLECKMPYLFIDTDAVVTKLFGQLYIEDYQDARVEDIIKYQYNDLYVLLDIDVPWVDDGSRDFPNDRQRHYDMIKKEIIGLGRNVISVKGNYDERFEAVKFYLDTFNLD